MLSNISYYQLVAKRFVNFFVQRGFRRFAFEKSASQVERMNRDELLKTSN